MITNPSVRALRYNPYTMELTEEEYDLKKMRGLRGDAIARAKKATHWGLILGTLGRQGNEAILERLKGLLKRKGVEFDVVLLSEISDAAVGVERGFHGSCVDLSRSTAGCRLRVLACRSIGGRGIRSR